MRYSDLVKKMQSAMNDQGEKLTVDGDPGPKTQAALEKFNVSLTATLAPVAAPIIISPSDFFGAPWIGANLDLLGRSETDPALNARYVPEWKFEGLPGYKTLSGNDYAWCSVRANADRRKVGVKGTNSAAAASWSKWGYECPFWFGAALPIRHASGGRHINDFLYWIDEKKKIAATLDGNRGNKFCVARTDLSGSGDTLVGGPRWSKDVGPGQSVSMADVLKKYPMLAVGSVGGSTR